ncbi:adenosylcobinamide-GDP ribazoletransferase [Paenochrobactrum pullorum]|uniref:adenosylcobinamide-GDP ribazoletransferase n=1 Tax=Paenochrobactrum pullorum TaxID=1324351 RepID=UPI0035BC5A6A
MTKKTISRSIVHTLGFLSRLPLPAHWYGEESESLQDHAYAFPLAGAVLGAIGALALLIASSLGLPPLAVALITFLTLAFITGALHEDGLGDTADGFFGGSTQARRLEIMKDSHIGTFAALTLIGTIGLKTIFLATVIEKLGAQSAGLAIIAIEAVSRAAMMSLWYKLPSARSGGLSDKIGAPSLEATQTALIIGVGILGLCFTLIASIATFILALLVASLILWGFAKLSLNKINGQTGDVLGAGQQITGLSLLLALVISL